MLKFNPLFMKCPSFDPLPPAAACPARAGHRAFSVNFHAVTFSFGDGIVGHFCASFIFGQVDYYCL